MIRRRRSARAEPPASSPSSGNGAGVPDARVLGPWKVRAGPYEVCPRDGDGGEVDWVWVVQRGDESRSVRVSVTDEAWASRDAGLLPRWAGDVIVSRGALAVIEAIRRAHEAPPERIVVETGGVVVLDGGA